MDKYPSLDVFHLIPRVLDFLLNDLKEVETRISTFCHDWWALTKKLLLILVYHFPTELIQSLTLYLDTNF